MMELDLSRPIGGPCSNPPTSKVPLFLRILTLALSPLRVTFASPPIDPRL